MKTFEELKKEVHEKLVFWIGGDVRVECIILIPDGSDVLTVKPIEEDIEGLVKRFQDSNSNSDATVEEFSKPDFCLSELRFKYKNSRDLDMLEKISNLENGADWDFYAITGQDKLRTLIAGKPSCPHGG